jgi:N-acetylneuraminic acid mutarotase
MGRSLPFSQKLIEPGTIGGTMCEEMMMRRQLSVLLLVFVLGTVALASAQDGSQPQSNAEGLPLEVYPTHMIAGEWEAPQPLELEPVDPWQLPFSPNDLPATDTCTSAPILGLPDGGQTVTNNMTESVSDPVLGCMWGTPSRIQGYRTVWYRFTPPYSGWVHLNTFGSSYDTVLAVYTGSCASLIQLACSDDAKGFTSQITLPVLVGQIYYVEVADWHSAVNGTALLNVAAWITTWTNWEMMGSMDLPRSRHAAAVLNDNIYIIGGQTVLGTAPERTPRTSRYNATTGAWTTLTDMVAGSDGQGYSNTAAALVNNKIYVPAGYTGNNNSYDGTHWVYDIAGNFWTAALANTWADGTPAIYSTATAYGTGSTAEYYVAGGLTGPLPLPDPQVSWQVRPEVYRYVPSLNLWFTVANMQTARFSHSGGLQRIGGNDYLCVVGGIGKNTDGDPVVLAGGECYNLSTTNQWDVTTGSLNFPRYNAGSAVDQHGNWYIFGGTDYLGNSVAATERYDPVSNTWTLLDARFDLGTADPIQGNRPPRAWPRGGFVRQTLYAIGGHRNTVAGDSVINLVERLLLPDHEKFLPLINNETLPGEPDDTFEQARPLALNLPQNHTFYSPDDYYDVFKFYVPSARTIFMSLRYMGEGTDNDLFLYTTNKVQLASSQNVGNGDELIVFNLGQGFYYLLVERVFPPPGADPAPTLYQIQVED